MIKIGSINTEIIEFFKRVAILDVWFHFWDPTTASHRFFRIFKVSNQHFNQGAQKKKRWNFLSTKYLVLQRHLFKKSLNLPTIAVYAGQLWLIITWPVLMIFLIHEIRWSFDISWKIYTYWKLRKLFFLFITLKIVQLFLKIFRFSYSTDFNDSNLFLNFFWWLCIILIINFFKNLDCKNIDF